MEQVKLSCIVIHLKYPRVEFFCRRVVDIVPRFQRIQGALPKCCRSESLVSQLKDLVTTVSQPANIYLISNKDTPVEIPGTIRCQSDVDETSFKASSVSENGINIAIFVSDVKDGRELEKNLRSLTERFCLSGFQNTLWPRGSLLFVGRDSGAVNDVVNRFRAQVQSFFCEAVGCELEQQNIIFEQKVFDISQHISDTLENILVEDCFVAIKSFLQNFIRKTQTVGVELPCLSEEESVTDAVKSFLGNSAVLADVRRSDDEDFIKVTLEHLSTIVKCTASPFLAKKHSIPDSICSDMLDEIKFTDQLTKAVKPNSVFHLKKLKESLDSNATDSEKAHKVTHSFDYLVYQLMSDWKDELDRVEKICANMCRLISVMKKMIFEIDGYLKQSKRYKDMRVDEASLSHDLKRKVLEINDVYGVGLIYGQLEIHIKQEEAREAVVDLLRRHNYSLPYSIKLVERENIKKLQF